MASDELYAIAKAYCERKGYTLLLADNEKFRFANKDGRLLTLSYRAIYEELKEEENETH